MSKKKNIIYNNRQVKTSMYLNDVIENDYFMALRQVCISIFEWENLPASMDQRKLELDLFNKGAAAGLYDKNSGVINTGVSIGPLSDSIMVPHKYVGSISAALLVSSVIFQ